MSDNIRIMEDSSMDEGTSVMSGQSFEDAALQMPEDARSGFGTVEETNGEAANVLDDDGQSTAKRSIKMTKKMKSAMKKIQDRVVSTPLLYFNNKAKIHPEWKLDDDEEAIIKESLSFVFDVLNIEFMIEQLNITLTSIWWVFLYPTAAIGMIFLSHKMVVDAKYEEKEEPSAE